METRELLKRSITLGAPKTITTKAGNELILIPMGEFIMGDQEIANAPPHPVYLDSYYIGRDPVTNAEYKKFVEATGASVPQHWQNGAIPRGLENHPVVNVNWDDAMAYCNWAGVRLPTEAEWEKAASWHEARRIKRKWPWGDQFDANKCNTSETGIKATTPVGKYSPQGDSAYGCRDMAGNVWEWCADWFDENYYANSPRENPRNDTPAQYRVLRGAAFLVAADDARCACRDGLDPDGRGIGFGFRVAVPPA
ncbi:MAG: formylglycine-generating enzyme family protein [Chloroflexi bacterium]|nr:formylglycine-generating enzyme family protein [Chloroflexota bacterium]